MLEEQKLNKLRTQIDTIDDQIFNLLLKRFFLAMKIAKCKKKLQKPIRNSKREDEIISTKQQKFSKTELSRSFIKKLLILIFEESRRIQRSFDK